MFSKLINNLEKNHGLDRKVEFLPSSKDLINREKNGEKLTRPELSVLLAYSKISVAKQLEATNFSDDEYLEKYLIEYFPKQMREKFLPEILSHQLKKQIINTVITNKIINQLTGTIVNTIQEQTGVSIVEIVKYYIVISAIFKTDEMWNDIEALPASLSIDIKIEMLSEINKLIRRGICWLITNNKKLSTIKDLIAEYVDSIEEISSVISRSLFGTVKDKYDARFKKFINNSINKNLAHKISILDSFISIFDIIKISNLSNCDSNNIAKIYFLVGDKLGLDFLRRYTESSIDNSYWNRLAVQSIKDDIYDMQRTIINIIIKSTEDLTETFDSWFKNNQPKLASYLKFIDDMKEDEIFNIHLVILATKKFRNYLKDFI
jgi:glutamate dehydrogenase